MSIREDIVKSESLLQGKKIVLYTIAFKMYDAAIALHNINVEIDAYIDAYGDNRSTVLKRITFNSFCKDYDPETTVLVIGLHDYLYMKKRLSNNGYYLNQNILVDGKLSSIPKVIEIQMFKLFGGVKNAIKGSKRKLITHLKRTYHRYNAVRGYYVYKKIVKKTENKSGPIYIYDYSGMGDVYVFSLYLAKILEKENAVLTVIGNTSRRVAEMFIKGHTIALSPSQSKQLTYYAALVRDPKLRPITPFPSHIYTDIYSGYLYGKHINMADAYRTVLLELDNYKEIYPVFNATDKDKVIKDFHSRSLKVGKTVILSPYANTVIGLPMEFWEKLARRIESSGYTVCTNASGKEKTIPGTQILPFKIEDAESYIETAGYFVGLRSGFCDLICNTNAKKLVIYPKYEIFNSSIYDFCSFEKMGIGKNIMEINTDYTNKEMKVAIHAIVEYLTKYMT